MSLNVYLTMPKAIAPVQGQGDKIFIREAGRQMGISLDEWRERFPSRIPVTCASPDENESDTVEVFSANITHNLNSMAGEANLYQPLWRPEELGITTAQQLIVPLAVGLTKLLDAPDHFCQFNPKNGWGMYEGLVEFTTEYLAACSRYPQAAVRVSR